MWLDTWAGAKSQIPSDKITSPRNRAAGTFEALHDLGHSMSRGSTARRARPSAWAASWRQHGQRTLNHNGKAPLGKRTVPARETHRVLEAHDVPVAQELLAGPDARGGKLQQL